MWVLSLVLVKSSFLSPTAISRWKHQFSSDPWSEATLSPVSTWMGDRLGTRGAVGILLFSPFFSSHAFWRNKRFLYVIFSRNKRFLYVIYPFCPTPYGSCVLLVTLFPVYCYKRLGTKCGKRFLGNKNQPLSRQRPYHVECTSSRPITEVKQRWASLVLGWVTAWEHWVLLAYSHFG